MADQRIGFVDDVLLCLGFFTRLPIGSRLIERRFADALWAAPVAGILVGLIGGSSLVVLREIGLAPSLAAGLALAVSALVTGALHEDGLGDVADGFGGGRDRAAKLAIMRDSRIGTYGVIAVGLSLILRWSALTIIAGYPTTWVIAVCVAAHSASRAILPAMLRHLPPARGDGLGAGVGAVPSRSSLIALMIGLAALIPLGIGKALLSVALLALLFFGLAWLSRRQIGGQTGDVLGALQQAAEALVLILAATSI